MAIGAFLPLAVFVVIAGSVGVRLTALWRRTGGVAERSLGIGLLIVTASMPISAAGRIPAIAMQPIGRVCFAAGLVGAALGVTLLAYFNVHVFRRHAPWAWAGFSLIAGLMLGSAAYMGEANFTGESVAAIKVTMRPGTLTLMGMIWASFAWGAFESFLCHSAARKRLALGMGDPVVANRFLLWGLASTACAALLVVIIACVVAGMVILQEPIPLLAIASCGILMSGCWYLTFFTPDRYRRIVMAGAGTLVR